MRKTSISVLTAALMTAAASLALADDIPPPAAAVAEIIGIEGEALGTVAFTQTKQGVLIEMNLHALPPGVHAVHIHALGVCDPETKFTSAGPHFATSAEQGHGFMTDKSGHAGDMPNQFAASDGTMRGSILNDRISLDAGANTVFDADGSAFVIHSGGDDYASQPSGNAGGRIGCGVIKAM